jgi:hypothetical protein
MSDGWSSVLPGARLFDDPAKAAVAAERDRDLEVIVNTLLGRVSALETSNEALELRVTALEAAP